MNINVIVVADTDLLSDRMWLEAQQRPGQTLLRSWADNDVFVINTLDYLTGSDALISLRSRGRFSRPFSIVDELQRQAQVHFQATYKQLHQNLIKTERTLATLRNNPDPHEAHLPQEQRQALNQYANQQRQLRQQLRTLQYQLNHDVDALGQILKLLNIALIPALLGLTLLIVLAARRLLHGRGH